MSLFEKFKALKSGDIVLKSKYEDLKQKNEVLTNKYHKEKQEKEEQTAKLEKRISEEQTAKEKLEKRLAEITQTTRDIDQIKKSLQEAKEKHDKDTLYQYIQAAEALGCTPSYKIFVTDNEKYIFSSCSITKGTTFSSASIALNIMGKAPEKVLSSNKPLHQTEYDKETRIDLHVIPIQDCNKKVIGTFGIIMRGISEKEFEINKKKAEKYKHDIKSMQDNIVTLKNKTKRREFDNLDKEKLKSIYLCSGIVTKFANQKLYGGVNKGGHMPIEWAVRKFDTCLIPEAKKAFHSLLQSGVLMTYRSRKDHYHLNKDKIQIINLYTESYPLLDKLWKAVS